MSYKFMRLMIDHRYAVLAMDGGWNSDKLGISKDLTGPIFRQVLFGSKRNLAVQMRNNTFAA